MGGVSASPLVILEAGPCPGIPIQDRRFFDGSFQEDPSKVEP